MNRPIRDWREQRVWIIGASSGIGRALAEALLERGARVAVSARREDALHMLAAARPKATVMAFDLTDRAAFARAGRSVPGLGRHRPRGIQRRCLCADARLGA
ncbi:MAG: SDR family NAD(P)-dependent oxidoreductase [Sulfuritalea sp.]|nr:SDR family NAD(P)-dependent oxidoreductase [Sulfuritalea sp.]